MYRRIDLYRFSAIFSCLMLMYLMASYIDVINHNISDFNYAWWNVFKIISDIS